MESVMYETSLVKMKSLMYESDDVLYSSDSEAEDEEVPPKFSDDITEFELSEKTTCLLIYDADKCKQEYGERFHRFLVEFMLLVRFKNFLPFFSHPSNPKEDGIFPLHDHELDGVMHHAQTAISIYNDRTETGRLEVHKIVKANFVHLTGVNYFMTLSATNAISGNTGLYHAAIQVSVDGGGTLLGFLLDCSTDTLLAILSLTGEGVEEALALKRKDLQTTKETGENSMEPEPASQPITYPPRHYSYQLTKPVVPDEYQLTEEEMKALEEEWEAERKAAEYVEALRRANPEPVRFTHRQPPKSVLKKQGMPRRTPLKPTTMNIMF